MMAYLGVGDFWEMYTRLQIDAVFPANPEYAGPRIQPDYDFYGRGDKRINYGSGSYDGVVHHNDGAIRRIIPELVEIGIDILNPIQWRCKGMVRAGLEREFGAKVIFHGGMHNQHTLPFGMDEAVRQEVIDNLDLLGTGGGYILAPCHNIQLISPPENIVGMY